MIVATCTSMIVTYKKLELYDSYKEYTHMIVT
jgi:hypothetical protein